MALGHPKGLLPLFFTEMWERLAFYTMVGILLLYTTDTERGGLGLPDAQGNEIYGLYLAFVYFTPFLGGMIADRFLGYRRAVALGGLLMATGLILMGVPGFTFFVLGLIGLIVGNGFFKPNISVMVGNLYEPGDPKRDSGFNIFYMGINIGALVATLIVAPIVRNIWGWAWTFRAAGLGVLMAVVILATQWRLLSRADRQPERDPEDTSFVDILWKIIAPAFICGGLGYWLANTFLGTDGPVRPAVCGFLAGMIPVIIFFIVMGLKAREDEKPGLLALLPIYIAGGAFFMILHLNGSAMTQWARDSTDRQAEGVVETITGAARLQQEAYPSYYLNAAEDVLLPHPDTLLVVDDFLRPSEPETTLDEPAADAIPEGEPAAVTAEPETTGVAGEGEPDTTTEPEPAAPPRGPPPADAATIARMYGQQRMDAAVIEYLEGGISNGVSLVRLGDSEPKPEWAGRIVDVFEAGTVTVNETVDSHGVPTVSVDLPDGAKPIDRAVFIREVGGKQIATYLVDRATFSGVYDGYRERFNKEPELLPPGEFLPVINPEIYQSWNPFWVIFLTPIVVAFFGWRVRKNNPVPTAHKLLYGMLLTTFALLLMVLAGMASDGGAAKVSGLWLMSFYLVVTFGELCLSPMGLSLVTKLSPKRLVGLTMGGWFMATAFGNNFSGFFGGIQHMMTPVSFFLLLAGLAGLVALFLFLVLPKLDTAIKKYGA